MCNSFQWKYFSCKLEKLFSSFLVYMNTVMENLSFCDQSSPFSPKFLDSTANWAYFRLLRAGSDCSIPRGESCMGPTVQLCCRDVLDPSPHSYSAVRTGMPTSSRGCTWPRRRTCVENRTMGEGGENTSYCLSANTQSSLTLFSLQVWPLAFSFLFLKGRSNIPTVSPYRITSLCSNFREIPSQVQWHCVD